MIAHAAPIYIPVGGWVNTANTAVAAEAPEAHQTVYLIGLIVVGVATLIAAIASYKKIVNSTRLNSFNDLERDMLKQRTDFREQLDARDKEHQRIMDAREAEFNEQLQTIKRRQYQVELTQERYGRAILIGLVHIKEQDQMLIAKGVEPQPIPMELAITAREAQENATE